MFKKYNRILIIMIGLIMITTPIANAEIVQGATDEYLTDDYYDMYSTIIDGDNMQRNTEAAHSVLNGLKGIVNDIEDINIYIVPIQWRNDDIYLGGVYYHDSRNIYLSEIREVEENDMNERKATLLHEVGHLVTMDISEELLVEYYEIYDCQISNSEKWCEDIFENMAEDFAQHFAKILYNYDYNKGTINNDMDVNKADLKNWINKALKEYNNRSHKITGLFYELMA